MLKVPREREPTSLRADLLGPDRVWVEGCKLLFFDSLVPFSHNLSSTYCIYSTGQIGEAASSWGVRPSREGETSASLNECAPGTLVGRVTGRTFQAEEATEV